MSAPDARAVVMAHIAGRIVAARIAAGHGHSDFDRLAAVKEAHEILHECEVLVSPAKQFDDAA